MASITLNGAEVRLGALTREAFGKLGAVVLARLHEGPNIGLLVTEALASCMKAGDAMDSPSVQSCLWCLHEMGVRVLSIDLEKGTATVERAEDAEAAARAAGDPYSHGNMLTGRAMVTALANLRARHFRLDGEEIPIRQQQREPIQAAMKAVLDARRVNEPIHLATARVLGALVRQGVAKDDPRLAAVLGLLSDLGVRAMKVDKEAGQLTLEAFNEQDAQAAAYLQGLDAEGIRNCRDKIRIIVAQAAGAASGKRALFKARRR